MVLSDNGKTSRYTYNAGGERIIKSHGDLEGVYVNGAPQGLTFHETEDYTIYPAPIITVTKNRFTKHYFIGDKRVASKLGVCKFSNVSGASGNNVTAGQKDYAARMMQIEKQREEYYKSLGTPPGVPTMKGATADPDNTGRGYNDIIGDLGDHSVPEGWVQHPKRNTTPGTPPGPPVQWNPPTNPEDVPAGYGYMANDTTREETFFYHSDHLGSTSYITDRDANITQFDAYLPYGELLVDEHSSSEDMPYKFNGKELDEETGLYYYGARYMDPKISMWLGVDPLMEKYPNVSVYCYTLDNPIRFIDPDGCETGGPGNYKAKKNTRTIGFFVRYPLIALKIGQVEPGSTNISTNATRFATRGEVLYGTRPRVEEERGSENGAFRHTLWQATITSEYGESIAKQVGNAHEDNPFVNLSNRTFSNVDDADRTVDLLNNIIGRDIGKKNPGTGMKKLSLLVLKEFYEKGLFTATKDDNGNWNVSRIKLSQEKYDKLGKILNGLNDNGFIPKEQEQHDTRVKQELEQTQATWGTMK